jgi:hypothetical protein
VANGTLMDVNENLKDEEFWYDFEMKKMQEFGIL